MVLDKRDKLTIQISKDTLKEIKILKAKLNLKTYSNTIDYILDKLENTKKGVRE